MPHLCPKLVILRNFLLELRARNCLPKNSFVYSDVWFKQMMHNYCLGKLTASVLIPLRTSHQEGASIYKKSMVFRVTDARTQKRSRRNWARKTDMTQSDHMPGSQTDANLTLGQRQQSIGCRRALT